MAITKRFRERGANITVTAAGEVLFMPGGEVHGWTRRFGNKAAAFSRSYAPTNKRPRWGHYGKPLKDTISSSPARFRGNGRDEQLVHVAAGSSAPHAAYVNNGTGGYMAKILPPWTRQSPSLYEHTWKVPHAEVGKDGRGYVEWEEVGEIFVKGQKGQHFFERGLDRAFQFMLRRAAQVGSDPRVTKALRSWPTGLDDFVGNTPANAAFMASLTEWRAWRDEAWAAKRILGLGHNKMRERREREDIKATIRHRTGGSAKAWQERKRRAADRSRRYRERQREKRGREKGGQSYIQQAQESAKREMAVWLSRNPGGRIVTWGPHGFTTIKGRTAPTKHVWGVRTADLFAEAGVQYTAPPKHT